MSPHPGKDEFARRLGVKHARLLEDLTKDLGLSATQSAAVNSSMGTFVVQSSSGAECACWIT